MIIRRVVIDSNVLLSAMLSKQGTAHKTILKIIEQGVLVFSEPTYLEIVTRLQRPKFDKWLSKAERETFLENLVPFADWVTISNTLEVCRDPQDDKFLETALTGKVDAIVTGDKDLLVLHPFENIPILTPADWLIAVSE